jgi:putative membrane protein
MEAGICNVFTMDRLSNIDSGKRLLQAKHGNREVYPTCSSGIAATDKGGFRMCPFCGGGWHGGFGVVGLIISLLFLVVFIAGTGFLIWWLVRQSKTTQSAPLEQPSNRAIEILNERYAKGEISKEEYEERRKILSQK